MEIPPKNVFWLRALRGEIYEMVKFDLYTFSTKFMLTPCMCGFMRYVLGRFQLIRSGQCGVCARDALVLIENHKLLPNGG